MTPVGFPHSDIHGSQPAFGSPWLFVDRYVLLRLPVPRHPPCALVSLTCPLALRQSISIMLESLFGFSLAIHPPCSSMDVSKILRRFRAQYTNSSCLASHSSLFLYSVFKVRLRRAGRAFLCTLPYSVFAACCLPLFCLSSSLAFLLMRG